MLDQRFTWAPLVGRIFLGGLFVSAGIQKVMDIEGTAGFIASTGLPVALLLAYLALAVEIIAGALLIVGYRTRLAALALALFTTLAIVLFHRDVANDPMALKDLAIVGGLLYVLTFGSGPYSLDTKRLHKQADAFS